MKKYALREDLIKNIREYFYAQDFHEVIVPILNTALPLEPNLHPFSTVHTLEGESKTFYLPMSPERGLKKHIAQEGGNCFAISPCFRNYERVGSLHLHEFLMLEWYRKQATYLDIMNEVERLLSLLATKTESKTLAFEGQFPRISLNTLFEVRVGMHLDALISNEKKLRDIAGKKGYKTENATWEELFNQLYVNEIETRFPKEAFFLTDFPARTSPLCKRRADNQFFAERFELYINGIEIANGNTENTDVKSIRAGFKDEQKRTGMPMDEDFLTSLESMKAISYAGVGLGIDRLVMLFAGEDSL